MVSRVNRLIALHTATAAYIPPNDWQKMYALLQELKRLCERANIRQAPMSDGDKGTTRERIKIDGYGREG